MRLAALGIQDFNMQSTANNIPQNIPLNAPQDIPLEIFRAYDIRGIVGDTLTKGIVFSLGRAIGRKVLAQSEQRIVVGRDGRISGPDLAEHLIAGLMSVGCKVVDIGQVATPVLYFATYELAIPSGVMITGSHNPVNYNGFKIMLAGRAIYGEEILELYHSMRADVGIDVEAPIKLQNDKSEESVQYIQENIIPAYIKRIKQDVVLARPLKVVVDCGNGSPGGFAPELYEKLGCEVIPLYCEVDGNFPNHHPDPGDPKNLQELSAAVVAHQADVGFGFDGDGDRLGVVDNTGKIIWPDRVLMLLAEDVLSRNPGATIIYDIKSSKDLESVINAKGGEPLMWKTGHSLIKAKMRETDALLAGEMSGHIFFKERWFGFDDALYAGARLLEIIAQRKEGVASIFKAFPENVCTPEIGIDVREDNKFEIVKKLIATAKFSHIKAKHTLDGLRVEFTDGWGLIRPSNTSPKLIARFEADSKVALARIQQEFKQSLQDIEPNLAIVF